jgi:hypothetical protein
MAIKQDGVNFFEYGQGANINKGKAIEVFNK